MVDEPHPWDVYEVDVEKFAAAMETANIGSAEFLEMLERAKRIEHQRKIMTRVRKLEAERNSKFPARF